MTCRHDNFDPFGRCGRCGDLIYREACELPQRDAELIALRHQCPSTAADLAQIVATQKEWEDDGRNMVEFLIVIASTMVADGAVPEWRPGAYVARDGAPRGCQHEIEVIEAMKAAVEPPADCEP